MACRRIIPIRAMTARALALPAFQHAWRRPPIHGCGILRGEGGREYMAERLRGQGVQVDLSRPVRREAAEYRRRRWNQVET